MHKSIVGSLALIISCVINCWLQLILYGILFTSLKYIPIIWYTSKYEKLIIHIHSFFVRFEYFVYLIAGLVVFYKIFELIKVLTGNMICVCECVCVTVMKIDYFKCLSVHLIRKSIPTKFLYLCNNKYVII